MGITVILFLSYPVSINFFFWNSVIQANISTFFRYALVQRAYTFLSVYPIDLKMECSQLYLMQLHSFFLSRHCSQGFPLRINSPVGHIRRKLCTVITTGIPAFLHSKRAAGLINGYRLCTFIISGFSLRNIFFIPLTPVWEYIPAVNPFILSDILSLAPSVVKR